MDEQAEKLPWSGITSQTIRRISFGYMPEDEIEWSVLLANGQRLLLADKDEADAVAAMQLNAKVQNRLVWRDA